MRACKILLCVWCYTVAAEAQVNRYMVFFKDKNNSPYSLAAPGQFLSAKAIDKRVRFQIPITLDDIPVNPGYVGQVRAAGAEVYFTSRWFNGVLVQTTPDLIPAIEQLPFVWKTELVAPGRKLTGGREKQLRLRSRSQSAAATKVQLEMLGLDAMHSEGIEGQGVDVAIFDSGFAGVNQSQPFQHLFADGRIKGTFDFVAKAASVYAYDDHGTEVMSVMAANSAGYTGGAHQANYFLFVTEDVTSEYRVEEYNWTFAAERADSAGVDVINSSLGYNEFDATSMNYVPSQLDGTVAVITQAASKAIERGMLVVSSAGNEGNNSWRLVTPPADAKGIVAVGAVNSVNSRVGFSSIGPTADGRIKPDVVALGASTAVVTPSGAVGGSNGTSSAAPLVASLLAGLRQKFPALTPAQLRDVLLKSGDQAAQPDNLKGYGLPHYLRARKVVEKPNPEAAVTVYPNPVTEQRFQIYLKDVLNESVQLVVCDVHGREHVRQEHYVNLDNNPIDVDATALPAGVYIVRVITNNAIQTLRFVKL